MLITCWHFVKLHCRVHKEKSAWVTASCSRPECCSPPAEIFLMLLPINLSHATCTKHALWNYILENTWNRSRHFMSWVKNISKGRVGNFPLRAKYKLLFLPLGTDENRCWFIRRRMKVVPKKYFPLLLRNRTSPSHSDLRSDEDDVCQLPPSRRGKAIAVFQPIVTVGWQCETPSHRVPGWLSSELLLGWIHTKAACHPALMRTKAECQLIQTTVKHDRLQQVLLCPNTLIGPHFNDYKQYVAQSLIKVKTSQYVQ